MLGLLLHKFTDMVESRFGGLDVDDLFFDGVDGEPAVPEASGGADGLNEPGEPAQAIDVLIDTLARSTGASAQYCRQALSERVVRHIRQTDPIVFDRHADLFRQMDPKAELLAPAREADALDVQEIRLLFDQREQVCVLMSRLGREGLQ